jgi:retinol dehydrogenase 12
LATYIAHHYAEDGILAFALNPGGINTELQRHRGWMERITSRWLGNPPWKGAITQLYAGTSTKLTKADSGKYFIPWAREDPPKKGT